MDRTKFKIRALENIDKMFNQVDTLHQKRDTLNASLKQSYDSQLESLNRRKTDLQGKLSALEKASNENWEEAKKALSTSMEHYKAGFNELKKLFQS